MLILVDEKDPSHSLKPQSKENHQWAVGTTIILLLTGIISILGNAIAIGALLICFTE